MARRARKSRAGLERWNQLIGALRLMNFAFNNVRLYPPTHAEVSGVIAKLHETLAPVFTEQDDVGFGFMDEMLYVEGAMSIEETSNNQMLVDRFTRCRVKYLTITKTASQDDLLLFFRLMNEEAKKPAADPPSEVLAKNNVQNIHVVEAEVDDVSSRSKLARRKTLLDWYVKSIATLKTTQDGLLRDPKTDLRPLFRMADDLMATIRTKGYEPFLLLPILGRGMDPHTAHGINAAILSCSLAELYGLNSGQIQTLCVAALLHDVGRAIIPPEWASDPSPLGLFERAAVHQHTTWSFLFLARHEEIPSSVSMLAARHHENPLDAGSKPGATGYAPDLFHRILNLADAYDLASASERFYWKKQRPDRILRSILRKRGLWYDPLMAKLLTQLVGYYPVGSLVRLDDGQKALVVRNNPANIARPTVYLYEAPSPGPIVEGEEPPPAILDLAAVQEDGLGYAHHVAGILGPEATVDTRALLDQKKEYLLNFSL
ncbi:MAG: hypothetical protein A2X36_09030 [Elusimicrobia bacterium GWA2_69_24]|nr:MAG: hypothetical protein A2X36_09030 [Elusimicrobia bacterium GWA2_69_24]HBL18032.1 hypothetical protein [Elusimicrobiota bacterium]